MPKGSRLLSQLVRQRNLYAGVYARVARKMGVDPSYVSKVANRERKSVAIETALIDELERISKPRRQGLTPPAPSNREKNVTK